MFAWIAQEAGLSDLVLTVRAQVVSPTDAGRLSWPTFFPRVESDSVRLADISTIDFRPVADRREWGQRGRQITLKTPDTRQLEMLPIESFIKVGEQEIQRLMERTAGNQALFRQIVGADIPTRISGDRGLAAANFRRLEIDAMTAWALGQITARDPQGVGADQTVSLQFAANRYKTAVTAWSDGSVNAFDLFCQEIENAEELIGTCAGALMRRADYNEIAKDAPRATNFADILPGVIEVVQRIRDRVGRPTFQVYLTEESLDVYDDGGTATTRTKIWPANRIGFIPEGTRIGSSYFAPVARAFELAPGATGVGGIDVRGNTVFSEIGGNGRELTVECQLNALPIPDESKVYVVKTTP